MIFGSSDLGCRKLLISGMMVIDGMGMCVILAPYY